MFETYDEALRTVLEIPPLERETAGARRVARCLFKPSFHPECSISLIERDRDTAMTLRVPERSVWSFVCARDGRGANNPVTDWVKPAVSIETVVLPEAMAASWRGTVDAAESAEFPDGTDWGLDGLNISGELWRSGLDRRFSIWLAHSLRGDARYLLALSMLETAMDIARRKLSVEALNDIRTYFEA